MTQVVSLWPFTATGQNPSQAIPCETVVDKVALTQLFFFFFNFSV